MIGAHAELSITGQIIQAKHVTKLDYFINEGLSIKANTPKRIRSETCRKSWLLDLEAVSVHVVHLRWENKEAAR